MQQWREQNGRCRARVTARPLGRGGRAVQHTDRAVPHNRLRPHDNLLHRVTCLWSGVQPHPAVRNPVRSVRDLRVGIGREAVRHHKVDGKVQLDVLLRRLLDYPLDELGPLLTQCATVAQAYRMREWPTSEQFGASRGRRREKRTGSSNKLVPIGIPSTTFLKV
jgi:hypothetical protein